MKRLLILTCLALIVLPSVSASAAEIVRIPLGFLTFDISSDGKWFSGTSQGRAAIWSRNEGVRLLGTLPGHNWSITRGISADGSIVAGESGVLVGAAPSEVEPYLWSTENAMIALGTPPGAGRAQTTDMSDDGTTVVGDTEGLSWIWTKEEGMLSLGKPAGFIAGNTTTVSGDGSIVLVNAANTALDRQDFIWDRQNGFQDLGERPPAWQGFPTYSHAMSADGRTVVGEFFEENLNYGFMFRWTRDEGFTPLPGLPGRGRGTPLDVTPKGSIVVGAICADHGNCFDSQEPFVWDKQHGTRVLRRVLVDDHGFFDAAVPELYAIHGISADARTLLAHTDLVTPWAIFLDRPVDSWSPDAGDFNGDGLRNAADINALSEQARGGGTNLKFELYNDGTIDERDRVSWVKYIQETWFGDANLDGQFSSADVVQVFQSALFETGQPALWEHGDWNGDGQFGASDLVTAFQDGGYERGPRTPFQPVPEPTIWLVVVLSGLAGCLRTGKND